MICEGGIQPNTAPLVHSKDGIINVVYNNEIKSVCDDGFSELNAETACNELYKDHEVLEFRIAQPCEHTDFWLDDVSCEQVEARLTKCHHNAFGIHNCGPDQCVFLRCAAQGSPTPVPVP